MHLYIITRGIKNWSDQFITELQGKYLPYKYGNPQTKQVQDMNLQVAVRPIQLYEIVFPEEHKDLMLTTILGKEGGKTQHKKHNKFIYALRRVLGVEKIPEYKTDIEMPITKPHTEIVGIGIKTDYWVDIRDAKRYDKKENEFCTEGL